MFVIPGEVKNIIEKLQEAGFEAYAVGGCVRDLLLNRQPKDWDVCTNALPEQIQKIFPDSFYENDFGTVSVKVDKNLSFEQSREDKFLEDGSRLAPLRSNNKNIEIIEVTTYRVDAKYTDKRHPDSVRFTSRLEDDLARRDFTINAIALMTTDYGLRTTGKKINLPAESIKEITAVDGSRWTVVDPFNGQNDLKNGVIRAVGEAEKRFEEDALRMLRAVRFSVELCFTIADETKVAIQKNAGWLQAISKERVRDELVKIIMSDKAEEGVLLLNELGLLEYVIPELTKGIGVAQNRHHIYTIFEHGIFSLKFAAEKKYNLVVRLAALLHDIAKPQAKRGEGPEATFYNHDLMGARLAVRILERLKFSREIVESVANLIRHHMFVYDVDVVTAAAVRRLLVRVGPENMNDLVALRVADRLGSGVPKAQPYRLRHFQYMVDKVQHDPISVKMLKINGRDIMKNLEIQPGPKIGAILDVLLMDVIEDPARNTTEYLLARTNQLNESDLSTLRQMAKEKIEEKKEEEDSVIKDRYWVK